MIGVVEDSWGPVTVECSTRLKLFASIMMLVGQERRERQAAAGAGDSTHWLRGTSWPFQRSTPPTSTVSLSTTLMYPLLTPTHILDFFISCICFHAHVLDIEHRYGQTHVIMNDSILIFLGYPECYVKDHWVLQDRYPSLEHFNDSIKCRAWWDEPCASAASQTHLCSTTTTRHLSW